MHVLKYHSNKNKPKVIMSLNDIITSNKQDTANLFSDCFFTIYSTASKDVDTSNLSIPTFDLSNYTLYY